MKSEIGRELKVSELSLQTVVVLEKQAQFKNSHNFPPITVWVLHIDSTYVFFDAEKINMVLIAKRTESNLEQIEDDSGAPIKIYEYLGPI